MDIQLSELVKVSNHSKITETVLKTLNEKLTVVEKSEFLMWLKLINYHNQYGKK